MQTEVARITAAERVQQVVDRVSLAAQQRAAAVTEEHRVTDETRVKGAPESEARVNPDERRRQQQRKQEQSPQHEDPATEKAARTFYNADEKEEVADAPGEHRLDISI
jgi:hypothetical protein